MKNIKRVVALACTLALTVGVMSGCKSNTDSGSEKEGTGKETVTTSDKPVTIDIFQFKVETKDQLEKAAKLYMEENKNVKINIQTVGGGDDYGAALRTKFSSGQEPTIYNIGGMQDAIDWKEKLEDLSSEPWVSQAFEGTLEAVKLEGKVLGMPFNQEGYGLIYNKAVLEKAGIDPKSIKSFSDLEKACETLESKKTDLGLEAVIALPGKEDWVLGLHMSNFAFSNEYKSVVDAFNAKTTEFKYADGFKKILDLQVKYAFKPDGSNKSINSVDYATQVEKKFALGKVAFIQQGNWAYGGVAGIDEELAQNIGFVPVAIDGVSDGKIPVGVPMYWAVNSKKTDDEKKAAKAFLNWLYTSDKGKEMIIKEFKFIPAFKGYEGDNLKPADPLAADILNFSNAGNTLPWVFMGYPTGFGQKQLGADMQKYIAGELTWEKLVENAKANWETARK